MRSPHARSLDAVVVGSGPNGLAAAITLARAGRSVRVLEAEATLGGGLRTQEFTLPGFRHDVCATVHALGSVSPFLADLPLAAHGLDWVQPASALAHPLPDGRTAVLQPSVEATAASLGEDGASYRRLLERHLASADRLLPHLLGPPLRLPRAPLALLRFGLDALRPAADLIESRFRDEPARTLFAGLAAHGVLPLERRITSAVGLLLAMTAHAGGWPFVRGGSQQLAGTLADHLRSLGGEIVTGHRVDSLDDVPDARAVLFDVAPRQLDRIAGEFFPAGYRRRLQRFRHGPGVFKIDWALREGIPWSAPECHLAGTVHVGGTSAEIAASERSVWNGEPAQRPFVILTQPSRFDDTRCPPGRHTAWAYCHVPHGSTVDATEPIEEQIERYAPGFRDLILARRTVGPEGLERENANLVGGDISGGVMDLRQFLARPAPRRDPYRTPAPNLFLCSASTPPGPGAHGMCGFHAARSALRSVLG